MQTLTTGSLHTKQFNSP